MTQIDSYPLAFMNVDEGRVTLVAAEGLAAVSWEVGAKIAHMLAIAAALADSRPATIAPEAIDSWQQGLSRRDGADGVELSVSGVAVWLVPKSDCLSLGIGSACVDLTALQAARAAADLIAVCETASQLSFKLMAAASTASKARFRRDNRPMAGRRAPLRVAVA